MKRKDGFLNGGMPRRMFLGGMFGSVAVASGTFRAFATSVERKPELILGLLADIHIGTEDADFGKFGDTTVFERALKWFDKQKVDGVVIAGDMAENGTVTQLKKVGEAWERVFPGNKASDGRTVEKLFVYGNHDLDGYDYDKFDVRFKEKESFRRDLVVTDPAGAWERVFREPYEPIWMKRVKGYQVIGAHWVHKKWDGIAAVEDWFKSHAAEIDRDKPIFYIQHPTPKDTCYGDVWGHDAGYSTRALSPYPKAVAFSGHAHCTQTDRRFVWQGAFTSIGLGSLRYGGGTNVKSLLGNKMELDNNALRWRMRQGALLKVWDGKTMTIDSMDFDKMEKLHEEIAIEIPQGSPAGDGYATLAAKSAEPAWPEGASLSAKTAKDGCVLAFPSARSEGDRIMAYVVDVRTADGKTKRRAIVPPGWDLAPHRVPANVEVTLSSKHYPQGAEIELVAVNSYGKAGAKLVAKIL